MGYLGYERAGVGGTWEMRGVRSRDWRDGRTEEGAQGCGGCGWLLGEVKGVVEPEERRGSCGGCGVMGGAVARSAGGTGLSSTRPSDSRRRRHPQNDPPVVRTRVGGGRGRGRAPLRE